MHGSRTTDVSRFLSFMLPVLLVACGASSSIRLETLPDDIDPGESEPLLASAPSALRRALQNADANPIRELLDAARDEGRNLDSQQLVIALLMLEAHNQDRCDVACLSYLELVYRLLALIADTRFHDTLRWFESWIGSIDPASVEAQHHLAFLRDIFDRAGERHDWVVARILRSNADEHARGVAVMGLAQRARSSGEHTRARQLFGLALPMLGDQAKVADVSNLARACYVVLDFGCGDDALARLEGMAESAQQVTQVRSARTAARTVARNTPGLSGQLARAAALVTLRRDEEAVQLYEEIAEDHPDDARPHVGLAELVFQRQGMHLFTPTDAGMAANEAIQAHLRNASTRTHREEAYYGLFTVSWNFRVLAHATRAAMQRGERSDDAPLFDAATAGRFRRELRAFCDDFETFDPGTAPSFGATITAFRTIGEFQLAVMSRSRNDERGTATLVAPLLERIRRQIDATPDNAAIYRTAILAAMLTRDDAFIAHVLAVSPPTTEQLEPTALARSRASLLIGLRSRDPNRIVGGSGDRETDALIAYVQTDDPAHLERLVEHADPDALPRILNNLAVALHRVGDARAAEILQRAQHDEGSDVLGYNALALTPAAERDERWTTELTRLAEPTSRSAVRLQAARLLSQHQGSPHASLAEAERDLARDHIPEQAAYVEGYQVGIGYTSRNGIASTGTTPLPWLLIEAPR